MKTDDDISALSDEKLVASVISKNQELYVHIVNRYQAPLIRYARSFVYDEAPAEDIVQNAFIKAYQNLKSFKQNKKFSSWIYRITHNEAMNYIKKHRRELQPEDESWFDTIADDRIGQEEETDRILLQSVTGAALAELDSKYREPLVLYYLEAKTYLEIGDILHVPTATVGTRISRAKSQLKKMLVQKGVEKP